MKEKNSKSANPSRPIVALRVCAGFLHSLFFSSRRQPNGSMTWSKKRIFVDLFGTLLCFLQSMCGIHVHMIYVYCLFISYSSSLVIVALLLERNCLVASCYSCESQPTLRAKERKYRPAGGLEVARPLLKPKRLRLY